MTFTGRLFPFQPSAVDRMVARRACILAFDLGLGKTVVTIAAIETLMDAGEIREPGLVVCLQSLQLQWGPAITRFTSGTSTPLVIEGSPKQREQQYIRAFDWQNSGVDYVVINYNQLRDDWASIAALPRGFVVLDEATAIKNPKTQQSKCAKKLRTAPVRYALTATPVENGRPEELFSLMEFVDRPVLGNYRTFDDEYIVRSGFGFIKGYKSLGELHARMRPVIIRKKTSDPDVAPHMPNCPPRPPRLIKMDPAGRRLYRHIVADLLIDLEQASERSVFDEWDMEAHYGKAEAAPGRGDMLRGQIGAKMAALRMLCDGPDLLRRSVKAWQSHTGGSQYLYDLDADGLLKGVNATPKVDTVVAYLKEFLAIDPSFKAVVFTTFLPVVDQLCDRLSDAQPQPYTGTLSARRKQRNKETFQEDPNTRLLVSSDAGGYGVDLPQANLLVNVDLPWSNGTALQRNGRIKRVSSTWDTIGVQDFIIDGSIEAWQHARLHDKSAVESALVDGSGITRTGGVDLLSTSLFTFLKKSSV